jgi:hypothetical protein
MQSPSATTRAPASFVCASNDATGGAPTGAMAGFHIKAAAIASTATTAPPVPHSNLGPGVIHTPFSNGLIAKLRMPYRMR